MTKKNAIPTHRKRRGPSRKRQRGRAKRGGHTLEASGTAAQPDAHGGKRATKAAPRSPFNSYTEHTPHRLRKAERVPTVRCLKRPNFIHKGTV